MEIKYFVKQQIQEYIQKEERSLSWIGRKLGMSRQMMHYFINKEKYSLEELAKIAELLSISAESLYRIDN